MRTKSGFKSKFISPLLSISMVDILANGVVALIIVVMMSLIAHEGESAWIMDGVERETVVLARQIANLFEMGSLPIFGPAVLRSYKQQNEKRVLDPSLHHDIDLYSNYIIISKTQSRLYRDDLLRENNDLDTYLKSLSKEDMRNLRIRIFDIDQFHVVKSILLEHDIDQRIYNLMLDDERPELDHVSLPDTNQLLSHHPSFGENTNISQRNTGNQTIHIESLQSDVAKAVNNTPNGGEELRIRVTSDGRDRSYIVEKPTYIASLTKELEIRQGFSRSSVPYKQLEHSNKQSATPKMTTMQTISGTISTAPDSDAASSKSEAIASEILDTSDQSPRAKDTYETEFNKSEQSVDMAAYDDGIPDIPDVSTISTRPESHHEDDLVDIIENISPIKQDDQNSEKSTNQLSNDLSLDNLSHVSNGKHLEMNHAATSPLSNDFSQAYIAGGPPVESKVSPPETPARTNRTAIRGVFLNIDPEIMDGVFPEIASAKQRIQTFVFNVNDPNSILEYAEHIRDSLLKKESETGKVLSEDSENRREMLFDVLQNLDKHLSRIPDGSDIQDSNYFRNFLDIQKEIRKIVEEIEKIASQKKTIIEDIMCIPDENVKTGTIQFTTDRPIESVMIPDHMIVGSDAALCKVEIELYPNPFPALGFTQIVYRDIEVNVAPDPLYLNEEGKAWHRVSLMALNRMVTSEGYIFAYVDKNQVTLQGAVNNVFFDRVPVVASTHFNEDTRSYFILFILSIGSICGVIIILLMRDV